MKLSILIPTHNRPKLFTRCLTSVLNQLPNDVEIIVNNDSKDIDEIAHPLVKYNYNKFDNLSQIYQFLLLKACGEYVYFLEDDDFLTNMFFKIKLTSDIIAGNYIPTYFTPVNIKEFLFLFKKDNPDPKNFAQNLNFTHLQLSQFIFRKTVVENFKFPMDNNIHNDINLVLYAASQAKFIQTTNYVMFYQTTDGGDNISFADTNSLVNTIANLDFLKDYEAIRSQS